MAPGRKREAKGAKPNCELSLGDLVLAKVKGFPAWPAKISRPEDWDRAPDPKKYFVLFFGTAEILLSDLSTIGRKNILVKLPQ
ncbi:ENHANCER OF AG-4 protein 2 [Sarracenia purpurea var. burkii]